MQSQMSKAFTRVELLVVLGVSLTVLLIFSDAISNAKYCTRAASCKAQLHQIGLAVHTYQDTHAGKMPPTLKMLQPAMGSQSPFICPSTGGCEYRLLSAAHPADIIVWDSQPHQPTHSVLFFLNHPNRNVLLADGQVQNMSEEQFSSLYLAGQTPFQQQYY